MALPIRVARGQPQYDPYDQLLRRDLGDALGRFFGGWGDADEDRLAPFGVDIREDADHLFVEADLPGFRKEDVNITLENGTLTIEAEKRQESPPAGARPSQRRQADREGGPANYLLRERRYERFARSFTLPQNVNEQNVQAKLDNGCLTITLNKREESKPKRVSIG
jgi:HSP20 family protein